MFQDRFRNKQVELSPPERQRATNVRDARFVDALIERTIFRRATLTNADFTGTSGTANFENALMEGVRR